MGFGWFTVWHLGGVVQLSRRDRGLNSGFRV